MFNKHSRQVKATSTTDKKQHIYEFLHNNHVAVLATVDPNGEPHAAVMYYFIDKKFNAHFTTKKGTKKSDNLTYNNHAMLLVFDAKTQTTAQITGTVSEIDDMEEAEATFVNTINTSRVTAGVHMPPISKLLEGKYVAYKLKPLQVRMAIFSKPDVGDYKQLFETLDTHELTGSALSG